MESKTNIQTMLASNIVRVPAYQRAYSWDKVHYEQFWEDLVEYTGSASNTNYYLGHFLYHKTKDRNYDIVDGQQRLTTITIFLCALKNRLVSLRQLDEEEEMVFENIVQRKNIVHFSTVHYDNQFFKDFVIDHNIYNPTSNSQKRIVNAYNYFMTRMQEVSDDAYLKKLMFAVANASCSTFEVDDEAEAIQIFIFQNNRGKKVTNLEILKADFLYNINLYGGDNKDILLEEIQDRFEHIYKSISVIDGFVTEDEVLQYTLKIYYDSLWESNSLEKTKVELAKEDRLDFIKRFGFNMMQCFDNVRCLFDDKSKSVEIESAFLCGHKDIVIPFFIKAYNNRLPIEDKKRLGKILGDLMLRDSFVQTRADLRSRLNDVFKDFDVEKVEERISWMKKVSSDNYWWAYWNDAHFRGSLSSPIYPYRHWMAKVALWKYENYLIGIQKKEYAPINYSEIEAPQLEHISPQTEKGEPLKNGYDEYTTEEEKNEYIYSIGNFLLLSGSHNESIGNEDFCKKRDSYECLSQQREIKNMTDQINPIWDKKHIGDRKAKIIDILLVIS